MKNLLGLLCLLASTQALAFKAMPEIHPLEVLNEYPNQIDFEGIVKLSNCSGSLVAFAGAPVTNKAIVMTNGHCVAISSPKQVMVNKPTKPGAYVGLFDSYKELHRLPLTKIIYASMDKTDVAFFETSMSYQEIANEFNVRPFIISRNLVKVGSPIEIISGYWEIATSCLAEAIVPYLKEGKFIWQQSVRYSSECMTKGGYSGSPLLLKNSRVVVGVHNTGNNGKLDCSDNNPCELNQRGELIFKEVNRRYAQQVGQFYQCLDQNFQINLNVTTCAVTKP